MHSDGVNLQDLHSPSQFDNEDESKENEPTVQHDGSNDHSQQVDQIENSIQDEVGHAETQVAKQQRVRMQPKRLNDFIVNLPPSIDHTLAASDQ